MKMIGRFWILGVTILAVLSLSFSSSAGDLRLVPSSGIQRGGPPTLEWQPYGGPDGMTFLRKSQNARSETLASGTTGTAAATSLEEALDPEELAFLDLLNQYRAENQLEPLRASIALTNAAQWMSDDMAQKNYFSHTDSLGRSVSVRIGEFGYSYNTWWGENIAAGNSSALGTFTQWKNSAGHNSNMLNPNYRVIGIGRSYNANAAYRWYWTTDFGGYVDETYGDCTYGVSPSSQSFPSSGGPGSVAVTAASACSWNAGSNASWITVVSGSSGSGNGTVNYSVTANTGAGSRSGTLTIAGQTFTVNQAAPACSISISPANQSFSAPGGTGQVGVTAPNGCNWTVISNASWVTVTSNSSGSGNGTVYFSVASNAAQSARTGTLTIASQTFTVNQAAQTCGYSIYPASKAFSPSAGTGSVSVTTARGCSWNAVSNASWISITSGSAGNGNGTVNYSVAANSAPSSRTASLTIAGQTHAVTQEAGVSGEPNILADPTLVEFGYVNLYATSTKQVIVSNTGNATLSVTGTSLSGPDASLFSRGTSCSAVAPQGTCTITLSFRRSSSSTAVRSATLTISSNDPDTPQLRVSLYAMRTSACSYSISPAGQSFPASGGTGNVSVAAGSGCSWSAVSSSSWVSVTSGSTGSGNGTVAYSVAANSGPERSAAITAAGQTFSVTQAGQAPCGYSLSPASQSFPSAGGNGTFSVTAGSGCSWSAASNDSWIAVTGGSAGSGSGSVSYSVAGLSGSSSRTGTITAGGQTFTVTQNGEGSSAVISLFPSAVDFGRARVKQSLTRTVTVKNTGGSALSINGVSVFSSNPATFYQTNNCGLVPPGGSCTVTVTFTPLSTGMKSGSLNVFSDASNGSPVGVSLKGTGY
jgi:uncharacterized protein YkwD